MSDTHRIPDRAFAHAAVVMALGLLASAGPPVTAQASAKATPAAVAAPVDGGWPRASTTPSGAALVGEDMRKVSCP